MRPIEKAIQMFGSQKALAKRLGVTTQVIYTWKIRGVPPEHIFDVSDAMNNEVSPREFLADWRQRRSAATA